MKTKVVKSRTEKECIECGCKIKVKDEYMMSEIYSLRTRKTRQSTCLDCASAIKNLTPITLKYYKKIVGNFWENVRENLTRNEHYMPQFRNIDAMTDKAQHRFWKLIDITPYASYTYDIE